MCVFCARRSLVRVFLFSRSCASSFAVSAAKLLALRIFLLFSCAPNCVVFGLLALFFFCASTSSIFGFQREGEGGGESERGHSRRQKERGRGRG